MADVQSWLDQARAMSAALSASLVELEDVHIRNAVVHLERMISELWQHANPAPADVPPVVPEPVPAPVEPVPAEPTSDTPPAA